tara:strand:- start:411 stop:809 length:399 start_codon:yes stop_codon:yes gene_type:complete
LIIVVLSKDPEPEKAPLMEYTQLNGSQSGSVPLKNTSTVEVSEDTCTLSVYTELIEGTPLLYEDPPPPPEPPPDPPPPIPGSIILGVGVTGSIVGVVVEVSVVVDVEDSDPGNIILGVGMLGVLASSNIDKS